MKTIFFEEHFGVNIADFKTTTEIDAFLEDRLGRKLRVKRIETNLL